MFFVKSIQFYFWKFQGHRNGNSHFISIQAVEGGREGRGGRIWKGTVGGMAVDTTVSWQFTHEILSGCAQKLLCEVHILHFAYFLC